MEKISIHTATPLRKTTRIDRIKYFNQDLVSLLLARVDYTLLPRPLERARYDMKHIVKNHDASTLNLQRI